MVIYCRIINDWGCIGMFINAVFIPSVRQRKRNWYTATYWEFTWQIIVGDEGSEWRLFAKIYYQLWNRWVFSECFGKSECWWKKIKISTISVFQALLNNIAQRFPLTEFLRASSVFNKSTWPTDPLEKALFGEVNVVYLCKEFSTANDEAAKLIMENAMYKKWQTMGQALLNLINLLKMLHISSAACERSFSQMNLPHVWTTCASGCKTSC